MLERSEFTRPVLEPSLHAGEERARIIYSGDGGSNAGLTNYFRRLDSRRVAAREAIAIVLQRADEEVGVRSR